jgi:hypothetical protein
MPLVDSPLDESGNLFSLVLLVRSVIARPAVVLAKADSQDCAPAAASLGLAIRDCKERGFDRLPSLL